MDELNKVHQLNEYLKELAEGELNLGKITDPETVSLLKLADSLQENLLVTPSPRFKEQVKENTLAAWQKRRLNQRRRLAKIIAFAAALLFLLSSLASATWRSQPGNLLYPVKKAIQKAVVLLTKRESRPSLPGKGKESEKKKLKEEKKSEPKEKKQEKKRRNEEQRRPVPPLKKGPCPALPSHQGTFKSFGSQEYVQEKGEESASELSDDSAFERGEETVRDGDENSASKDSEY